MKRVIALPLIIVLSIFVLVICVFAMSITVENAYAEESYTSNAVITVLTHGLGGSPTDWSNDGLFDYTEYKDMSNQTIYQDFYCLGDNITGYHHKAFYSVKSFSYEDDSLIEQLRQKNPNSVVYIVSANNTALNDGHPYIDKFTPNANSPTGYSAQAVSVNDMDFSKHSIIVYNASGTWKEFVKYNDEIDYSIDNIDFSQDSVVEDFFTTIDYIVNAYKNANNQIYPKINLIGHSQGTVVNLLYATKYPDMIDSMFALGGLLNGSEIIRAIYRPGEGTIAEKAESIQSAYTDYVYLNGAMESLIDMITCTFGQRMADESYTNAIRTNWNERVQGKPIKGYAVGSYFDLDYLKALILEQTTSLNNVYRTFIDNIIKGILTVIRMGGNGVNMLATAMMNVATNVYELANLNAGQQSELLAALTTIIDVTAGELTIPFDGFLELETQDATGYSNFQRTYRRYGYDTDFSHKAQKGLEIVHNLETQDAQTINYICSNITIETSASYTVKNGSIKRVNRVDNNIQTLSIPDVFDSQTITSLGEYSFADNLYDNTQVESIVIPATVTEIGTGAFQNCTNLTSVTFAPGSQLTTIYAYAFAGCTNLTSIDLPNSVTTIYEYAFADTGLTSCNLKNVSSLGYGVFSECHDLTGFSKNSWNGSLSIESGKVVYGDSSSQLLAYACGNTGTSFTISNSVTIIGEGAFKGANHLTSVTFPSSLSEVRFSAFENCTGLTSIELPGTVTDIGAYAFCGCYNLTSVRMFSTGNIAIGMGAFTGTDTVGFAVPQARINYYKQTAGLSPYESQVTAITYQISYVTYNGQSIDPTTVYYGVAPMIVDHNTLTRPGYAIAGWYLSTLNGNGTGTAFNASMPYTTKDNTTLYAMWVQMSEGNVSYDANATGFTGVMDNSNVEYNGTLTIPACSFVRPGYECVGWATTPNGNVVYQSGHTYTFALTSPLTLYAKWMPITYSITYNVNNATGGTGSLRNYYTVENNYTFPAVSRTGYVFYGWVLVGNEDGIVLENTVGYSENITMRAEWEITYSLGTNSPTTISSTASILDFSGCSSGLYVNKTFTLTRLVDSITLKNINNLQNLSFDIDNGRSCRIKLIFDNVSFTGRPGCPAIKAISVNLDVYVKTNTTIHGGTSYMPIHNIQLEDVVYMASGITFYHMSVYRYPGMNNLPILTVHGGNGANGASGETGSPNGNNNQNGGSGSDGGNGCMGAFGLFGTGLTVNEYVTLMAFGGDGGNGGNGGSGGKGGNATASVGYGAVGVTGMDGGNGGSGGRGGDGVYAACIIGNVTVSAQAAAYFQSGKGGDGGNGGEGGTGGKGGNGGDGKFGVHAGRGGTGGDGGYGGFGGDGGDTATDGIVYFSKNGDLYNYHGLTGSGGSGGAKGSGGDGGRGGKKWPTNNYAETGYTGSAGQNGYAGHNGHLQ